MLNNKISENRANIFSENLFKKSHKTNISSQEKTIDYLVNFSCEAIKEKLGVVLFVSTNPDVNGSYLIEEKIVEYQPLFYSQLSKNAIILSKVNLGKKEFEKYNKPMAIKRKSLEEISEFSKKELVFDSDFEKTLYTLYLEMLFPEKNFRPVIVNLPVHTLENLEAGYFIAIYTIK
ncbi:MAG TPA: hypothetical protein PLX15_03525 [Candidatus Woesearchaeota archaeon]|nr:hypothetical protein [Candidatus Woesearchaeota archaeon]